MTQYAPPARPSAHGFDPRAADPRAAGANPLEALRHHVVTAVLVSHDGARWLGPVLDALLNQRRPVQRIIAVDTGSRDNSVELLEAALGADQVLERKRSTGYGAAVAFGLKSSPPVGYDEFGYDSPYQPVEWIWLLHDDSAPAPDALGQLLLTAEDEPDAAVLGPKIRGWYDMVGGGAGFLLVETENPQEVNEFLMPYMDLMAWDVRAVNALQYDTAIERFRQSSR